MSADNAIIPLDDGAAPREAHDDPGVSRHQEPPSPLRKGLMIMRGRWLWAIGLGVVLAAIGGTAGYLSMKPIYRSQGVIDVQPNLPRVLYRNEVNEMMPMFEGFIRRQVERIRQQRVVQQVLRESDWESLGAARGPASNLAGFARRLSVENPRRSQLITVSFHHPDPQVAQTAVRLVIEAYEQIYRENNVQDMSERMQTLRQRRDNLRSELNSLRERRLDMASDYGTDDLDQIYRVKLEEVNRLESELDRLQFKLARAGSSAEQALGGAGGGEGQGQSGGSGDGDAASQAGESGDEGGSGDESMQVDPAELTVEWIAARDQRLRNYIEQRDALERELRLQKLSLGDNHRKVEETRTMLSSLESSIQQRAEEFRKNAAEDPDFGSDPAAQRQLTVQELEANYRNIHELHRNAKAEASEIGNQRLQLESLKKQEEDLRERLERTEQRIEELEVESSYIREQTTGRINVLSYGDEPLSPYQDRRNVAGFAGVTFGGGFGVAVVLLIGFFDSRLRNIEEAEDTLPSVTLLGILPGLPQNPTDPDEAETTAHAVHRIRTLLQIGPDTKGGRIFSVTSPVPGDGKTSLTLALGMSFSTSGAKTLLVDCDLFQAGLSQRMSSDQNVRVCQALRRNGRVPDEKLQEAMGRANAESRGIGEVLIEMGALAEADLRDAIPERALGLLDVLEGESLEACIVPGNLPNLWVLPSGSGELRDSSRLAPATLHRLFEQAREAFDIVMVDTGPVSGSLEATQVAVNADGVVMVISRGGNRSQVEQAVRHLTSLGAHLSGVVFNRAQGDDMQRMSFSYGSRSGVGSDGVERDRYSGTYTDGGSAIARTVAGAGVGNGHTNGENDPGRA